MTLTELTILTSCAALATALATLWTVFELRSQRIEGLRPELLPARHPAHAKCTGRLPSRWDWREVEFSERVGKAYSIPLFNIGSGPAKDITVIWEYPLLELVDAFNVASRRLDGPFLRRTGRTLLDYELVSRGTEKVISLFNSSAHIRTCFEYILPSAIGNKSTPVPVPLMFLVMCALCVNNVESLEAALDKVAKIRMRLEYRDLANSKYERIFHCQFRLFSVRVEEMSKELIGEFSFE
jgi:hypothetical protein